LFISEYYCFCILFASSKYADIVAYATEGINMMHKTYQVNDLRVKRTEKLIFDALMQLTIHKGFAAVTVSDITQTAGINRATFYRVMWGKHGDPDFAEKIRVYIQKRIRKSLPKNVPLDEQRIDLFVSYSASASFGAVLWWLGHDMPYSSEEMIRILQHLESENIKALLK
jgi:hypothetical protein